MEYRNTYRAYTAWNYDREIEDLDHASEQGWQLVRGGCFHSRFVNNPDIRYRYQMDYGKVEDMGRYIETFREQGWEYINSTFNGWHYFRKLYDPSAPEEAYEIFTDRESLREMNERWARIALAIGIALALFAVLSLVQLILRPQLPTLVRFLTFAIESAFLLRGVKLMRSGGSGNRSESRLFYVFLAVIVLGLVGNIVLEDMRPNFSTQQRADSVDAPVTDERWMDFDIRYPDNYYLDIGMEAGAPMTFSVVSESGEAVYSKTSADFHEEDVRLKLPRGKYCFSMSASSGYAIDLELS